MIAIPKTKQTYILSYPPLKNLDKDTKNGLIRFIHFLEINGASSFYSKKLKEWFGDNYTTIIRKVAITDNHFSVDDHKCKTYWLKEDFKNYMSSFTYVEKIKNMTFDERPVEEIVDGNGRTLKQLPTNSVLREDVNGLRKKSTVDITKSVYIDYEKLKKVIGIINAVIETNDISGYNIVFEPKKPRTIDTLKDTKVQLETLLLASKNVFDNLPNIPVQYQELGCGRLQGIGLNPQNLIAEIRNYILSDGGKGNGLFDYDMSNCHFTLAYQIYNQIIDKKLKMQNYRSSVGLPYKRVEYKKLHALENYLQNKDNVRKEIAVETGMWISEVKVLLISIMYGKRVPQYLLQQSGTLRALKSDIDTMVELVTKDQCETGKAILNAMGKVKDSKRLNKYKKLNHILLGLESYIIQEVATKFKNNVLLLMYDGFIANVEIFELINFPQHFVIGEWGFSVQFEMKKL